MSAPVQRMLDLQRLAGNAAVARSVETDRHQHGPGCGHAGPAVQRREAPHEHGPGCGHGAVEDTGPTAQRSLLDAARNTPSTSLPGAFLAKAKPFFQNDRLSEGRVHDNPIAQRATAALGAEAMTVGKHIFLGPKAVGNTKTLAHEASHLDKNIRGIPETGNNHGAGLTVTDPGQGSERAADTDSDAFMSGAGTAPSVVAQRSVAQGADDTGPTVQRSTDGVVQRTGRRRRRGEDESDMDRVVGEIENPAGRSASYKGGGESKKVSKSDPDLPCWDWAVRAAAGTGGLDRGDYWSYLTGWLEAGGVPGLSDLAPAVREQLAQVRDQMQASGLHSGPTGADVQQDETTIQPLMQRAVEGFVTAHGFQIKRDDPAAWIMCHYKMDGTAGTPEHFWVEIKAPSGRVLVQTVPGMDHFEAGGTDLRWNDPNSTRGRRHDHDRYVTIQVPVEALKGRHTEILMELVNRNQRPRLG
ncbi:DUF4157 domain-containing protein [Streptomyces sp. NPDC097107]|uniref:eCIS core domain-containing protein n=1 Tax=Streptomyces sp. NPDC097107 TaxID=3366089 RepID=UPI003829B8FC